LGSELNEKSVISFVELVHSSEETLVKKDKKLTGKSSKAIAKMRRAGLDVQELTGVSMGFIGGIPPRKK
jgi:hypothetical protein